MREEGNDAGQAGKVKGCGDVRKRDAEEAVDKDVPAGGYTTRIGTEVKETGAMNGDVRAPLAEQEDEELSSIEEQLELDDTEWPDSIGECFLILSCVCFLYLILSKAH